MAENITITFPDGTKKEFEKGVTPLKIAEGISEGLARAVVAAKSNDQVIDITTPLTHDTTLQLLKFEDPEGRDVFWHSAAHLLAHAVTELYPSARLTIGPVIEGGFYYDFDHDPFTPEDLEKIEAKMKELVKDKTPIERKELSKKEALEVFKDNPYKIEIINELPEGETITAYQQGTFVDLCRGPHVSSTSKIKSFKLLKIAGAYWKGDAKNKQLQRIYGVAYPDKKELKTFLEKIEEAKKRDHRKIGKEMDLFSFHEEGPGFPFFHSKGMVIWNELADFWRHEHRKENYEEVKTPIMLTKNLWETSGHWANYKENMYLSVIDEREFAIKPMSCPGGMLIYKEKTHSYRDLPLRVGEIGHVHRHELAGVLSGLFRVRSFHQDDAHIFMMHEQIQGEVLNVINMMQRFYKLFGLDYHLELSTRPEKSIGTAEMWNAATNALKGALDELGENYEINEGDGAFYGPKIDVHIKDCLGRTWQCSTIQLDMSLPERFELTYEGEDGKKHRPVMIHHVIYGSIERFMGIIIEHYAGKFPLWLSPVQVAILPIADRHAEQAFFLKDKMQRAGLRVEVHDRAETVNKKVRDAQIANINYILVVGDKELENKTVNVRTRDNVVHGEKTVDAFIEELTKEIASRS